MNVDYYLSPSNFGERKLGYLKLFDYVSHGATYDSPARFPPPTCHPRTRKQVLNRIKDWIQTDTRTHRVLWLYGSAGIGKSAIAQTIAEYCHANYFLGATFFFSRADPERNDANRIFPTLAWQLLSIRAMPEVKQRISASLEKDPLIPTRSLETQFEQLVVQPVQLTANDSSLTLASRIVIIDGLDECGDEKAQQHFLTLLGNAVSNEDREVPLRFLICSRPEPHIREAFDRLITVGAASRICLDDDRNSYNDIRQYLAAEFPHIESRRPAYEKSPHYQTFLDRLVQRSSGHFMYAATLVKFVGDMRYDPKVQPLLWIAPQWPFAELYQLYLEILSRQPDQVFLKTFLDILCMCMEGSEWNVNGNDLIMLCGILFDLTKEELFAKLRGLHSLLDISHLSIHVHHISFLKFLRDHNRSGRYYFDGGSWSRNFAGMFLELVIKHASNIQHYNSHENDKHTSICVFLIRTTPTNLLRHVPLDQRNKFYRPIQILRDEAWKKIYPPMTPIQPIQILQDKALPVPSTRKRKRTPSPSPSVPPPTNLKPLHATLQSLIDTLDSDELRAAGDSTLNDDTFSRLHDLLTLNGATIASEVETASDAELLVESLLRLLSTFACSSTYIQDMNIKLRRLMFKLISKIDTVPRSLLITDIEKDPNSIAMGGYGNVFEGKRDGQLVALKILYKGRREDSIEKDFLKEALSWRSLSHCFILPLLGIYEEGSRLFLVSPFMAGGTIRQWRKKHEFVRIDEIHRLLLEVADGFEYIHGEGIVHGDLHGGNVLLNSENHCQITDFGSARHFEATITQSTTALAFNFAAPELFGACAKCGESECEECYEDPDEQHKCKTMKTDVYAFGCLYYAIFFDTSPFQEKKGFIGVMRAVLSGTRPHQLENPKMDDNTWKLIQSCWERKPSTRPPMERIAAMLTPVPRTLNSMQYS